MRTQKVIYLIACMVFLTVGKYLSIPEMDGESYSITKRGIPVMQKDNIPSNATKISYPKDGVLYHYHTWQDKKGRWVWSALGNTGLADSEEQAGSLARRWIRDGQ